jgi:hypothetical protein
MKLNVETGSLMNWITGNTAPITPEVGMGATLLLWTDRHAMTIHKVDFSGKIKKLWASRDKSTRIDNNGMSESQLYVYNNDDNDISENWELFTLRKDGRWHRGTKLSGNTLFIGHRDEYCDYSF